MKCFFIHSFLTLHYRDAKLCRGIFIMAKCSAGEWLNNQMKPDSCSECISSRPLNGSVSPPLVRMTFISSQALKSPMAFYCSFPHIPGRWKCLFFHHGSWNIWVLHKSLSISHPLLLIHSPLSPTHRRTEAARWWKRWRKCLFFYLQSLTSTCISHSFYCIHRLDSQTLGGPLNTQDRQDFLN